MNYLSIYYSIIKSAKNQQRKKTKPSDPNHVYYEKHHIIPRCIMKDRKKENLMNQKWNLVLLTAREHFICHRLLVKISKDTKYYYKMVRAISNFMYRSREYNKLTARSYDIVKNEIGRVISYQAIQRNKDPVFKLKIKNVIRRPCKPRTCINKNKGRIITIKTRFNKASSRKFIPAWNKGLTKYTDERVAVYAKAKVISDEHKKILSVCATKRQENGMLEYIKDKIRKNNKLNKKCVYNDVEYISISEAARLNNTTTMKIRKHINRISIEETKWISF